MIFTVANVFEFVRKCEEQGYCIRKMNISSENAVGVNEKVLEMKFLKFQNWRSSMPLDAVEVGRALNTAPPILKKK